MSESGPVLVEREVPNPAYERLEDLLTTVERAKGVHANGLRRPVQLMGEGAWSGRTAARPFELELQGRHTDLPGYFDDLIAAVRERMAQVPATRTITVEVW